MTELITVKISDLKENNTFSELVPEMTTQEYDDLVNSIRKQGVRQPIHILSDKTVLDGRHRVRACKEIGIKEIQALSHELTEDEAIKFVTDTAVERRNLTKEQKVDIIFRSEELIRALEEEAVEHKKTFKGNQHTKVVTASDEAVTKTGRTSTKIAEMAGTSRATVNRMKKVKTEDPELYNKVVTGEESASGAYYKLPSVQQPKPKKQQEPKEPKSPIPYVNPNEEQYQNISREDSEQSIAYENLIFNLRQLDMYIEGNKNRLTVAIRKAYQENPDLLKKSVSNMEMLTKFIQEKEEN